MKIRNKAIGIGVLLAVGAAGAAWFYRESSAPPTYRTARVERGSVVQTVKASGIVRPITFVDVGTQVNGPVSKLYVDYNSAVKAGDLVAQIDPIVYEARLAQDEANMIQSLAGVEQARAQLTEAEKELSRAKELAARDMLSQAELDAAIAGRDSLAAQLKVAEAAVKQAEASLRLSKANLGYTTIRSPIDGVVISRNVSEGQTVVANLSAQVLFQIATDLKRMQVEASIPEADIGQIRQGQPVTFTVDAYEEEFRGTVSQVRFAATTVQNVVTYPVVITADNPDGRLLPGMTASIACEVAHVSNVLKVVNAALRFTPPVEDAEADSPARPAAAHGPRVWIPDGPDGAPAPVSVRKGITDGQVTALTDPGTLKEGQEVIVGLEETPGEAQSGEKVNPFAPRFPRGRRH